MKTTLKQRQKMKEYDSIPENKKKKMEYMKRYLPKYEKKNKERISERKRKYYLKNKKRIDKRNKECFKKNKNRWNKYKNEYYKKNIFNMRSYNSKWERKMKKEDINFVIRKTLRSRLKQALKIYIKSNKLMSSDEYGIDYNKIMEYLKPFPEERKLYHIDHIKPLCSFDLTNPEEVKKAFAPENHRWLLAIDNLHKISEDKKQSLRLRNDNK